MTEDNSNLKTFSSAEEIYKISIKKFNSLPCTGKPNKNEWTVLSCILEYNEKSGEMKVVSLGTGTKCIGQDQICSKGLTLNDCHAEVMARRGLLRYFYENMMNCESSKILTFNQNNMKFCFAHGISYHFFSTHAPCGDATIVSKSDIDIYDKTCDEPSEKRQKLSKDCNDNFTGAKLLWPNTNIDLMAQDEGALRTKPGRGIRTLSMSCSDKLSRWNVLGIQGALIDMLINEPVYLKTLTFMEHVDENSLKRAIYERFKERCFKCGRYQVQTPQIRMCSTDLKFEFMKKTDKDPSPASIVWCDVREKPLEVSVSGKRQGVTKSKRNELSGALRISKQWLMRSFQALTSVQPLLLKNFQKSDENVSESSYKQLKHNSKDYQSAWKLLKEKYFLDWTKKPEKLLEFKLEYK